MKEWTIRFWTPGHAPAEDSRTFGCATHGLAGPGLWVAPTDATHAGWPTRVTGTTLAGTYAGVLAQLEKLPQPPAAAVVVFARGTSTETFLERWTALLPGVPAVGGAAASPELRPAAADVAVLLIQAGRWRAETLNAHDATPVRVAVNSADPRTLSELRRLPDGAWETAAEFYRARQREHQVTDCESVTFSDAGGRNIHCSLAGETLRSGANLPPDGRLTLRTVSRAQAAARLAEFCAVPNALVFGCAGLRSLLDAPLPVAPGTLVGFMFGELVTLDNRPQFGNLMAARLMPVEAT